MCKLKNPRRHKKNSVLKLATTKDMEAVISKHFTVDTFHFCQFFTSNSKKKRKKKKKRMII